MALRHILRRDKIWSGERLVRSSSVSSVLKRSSATRQASSVGTLVNKETTSKDSRTSSGSMVCIEMNSANWVEFFT